MSPENSHGRTGAEVRRKMRINAAELIERLKQINFTQTEQVELKVAMDAASEVFAHGERRSHKRNGISAAAV